MTFRRDLVATPLTGRVLPAEDPTPREVDRHEPVPSGGEQSGDLSPLEGDGGTFRIVFVVACRIRRSFHDVLETPGESLDPSEGPGPFLCQEMQQVSAVVGTVGYGFIGHVRRAPLRW